MSTLEHTLEPEATTVHRLEVITGTGRRRRFSEDFKARIVEETLVTGSVVSEVARRHGLTPQQLFTGAGKRVSLRWWRTPIPRRRSLCRQWWHRHSHRPARERQRKRIRQAEQSSGSIEVEIEGVTVRIGRGAEAKTVAAVLRALKAGA